MQDRKKPRAQKGNKMVRLLTQAERARKLAAECGSSLVAELYEVHAGICEQNARARRQKRRGL